MDKNFYEDLKKSLEEINELLEKSGHLYKDEDEGMPAPEEDSAAPSPAPEGMPAPEEESALDGPSMEGDEEGQEMPEGEDEGEESIEELISSMSEEQLRQLLELIQASLSSKSPQSPEGAGDMSPEGMPSAPSDGLQKSKEEEKAKPALSKDKMPKDVTPKEQKPDSDLKKSIDGLVGVVEKLVKDVAELKAPKKQPAPKVVSKPAAFSNAGIQVLEKSVKSPERLSKSETLNYLQNQIRQGNRLITARHVNNVNYANTQEELAKVQDVLVSAGIVNEFPKK